MRFKSTEDQRVHDRAIEERHKKAKRRASESGKRKAIPAKPAEGPSIWRRMFDAMTGHKSRLQVIEERDGVKARAEAKKAKPVAQKHKPHGWKAKA